MPVRVRWRGLELPVQVRPNQETHNERYGEFVVEPFERGYGHTIGNSLRRMLLSSIEGSSVVAVKIHGVHQEFAAIEGVREDVTEIILNIKQLALDLLVNEERKFRLEARKKGPITAGHIEDNPDLRVVDPHQHVADLTDDVEFVCDLYVRRGRGYVVSEEHEALPTEIGVIPVDSLFSPVRRVAYRIEDTRVGRRTDYDRLVLQVWTNGVVTPEMALVEAAKILRKHLNPFVEYFELGRELPPEEPEPLPSVKHLQKPKVAESHLTMPVGALRLSARSSHCLESEGINTVGQLLERTEEELLAVKNFGKVSLLEVQEKLAEQGLEVGLLAPEVQESE